MPVVKKSVALHPIIDKGIRRTWAMLIDMGYDASYSTAINVLILSLFNEAVKEAGLSDETINLTVKFLEDRKTIDEINMADQLAKIYEHFVHTHKGEED